MISTNFGGSPRRSFITRHESGRITRKFRGTDLRAGVAMKKNGKDATKINAG